MNLQQLFEDQSKLLSRVQLEQKRYLYSSINWKLKSIGILGQRGVGKTTMMLQYIKEHFNGSDEALYISLDNPYFQTISLLDFAKEFEQYGGKILFVDEVHKYSDWSSHIKTIYDLLDLRIVFSGSSILQISKQDSDLSRRTVVYHLENLSFREYISLKHKKTYEAVSLEILLDEHKDIANTISKEIKPLKLFREYLQYGAYPFIIEDKDSYHQKIIEILNLILEVDMPLINNIEVQQIAKLKRLIYLLAVNVPFIPNIKDLSDSTNISRPKVYEYLNYLENAKIINSLHSKAKGYSILSKPEKLFMQNTNITYALTNNIDIGSARESFFVNQIKNYFGSKTQFLDTTIHIANKGDFLVNETYHFEIGGKNKSFKQIKDIPQSYIAADEIEIGYGNKIPLWLFGFLY
jgi:predicted AAA+ superfamily ATPase